MEFKSNQDEIEKRFTMLLKSIPIPTLLWKKMNHSLTLVNSNEASSRISGGKIKEYIGRKASEIYKNNSQILKAMQECALNNHKFNLTANDGKEIVNNGITYNISFEFVAPDTIVQYFTANSSVNKKILKNDTSKKEEKQDQMIQQATIDCLCKIAPIGIVMVVNRNIVQVNDRFCELVGYDREELINKSARMVYPSDEEYEHVGKELYEQINKYGTGTVETQFRRKDGKLIQFLLSSALVDPKNPSLGTIFTALDITKIKRLEKELVTKEKRFHEFVNMLPLVVFEMDAVGNLSFVNEKGFKLLGYSPEDIENGLNALQVLIPSDRKKAWTDMVRNSKGENLGGVEYLVRKKNGELFPVLVHALPKISDGKHIGFRGTLIDITERKNKEIKLKESEETYRILSENSDDLISLYDEKLRMIYINAESHSRVLGYPAKKFLKFTFKMSITHKDDIIPITNIVKKGFEEGSYRGQIRFKHQKGHYLWFQITAKFFSVDLDKRKLLVVARNITDIKQVEKDLRESEEKYRCLTENSDDLISLYDEKFRLIYVNAESHSRVLGYPEKKFLKLTSKMSITHKDDIIPFTNIIKKGIEEGSYRYQIRFKHQKGHYLWFQVTAKFFSVDLEKRKLLVVSREITDIKQAEKNLRESEEKFRTIAELAFMGIMIIQEDKIKYINAALLNIFGFSSKDVEGWTKEDITRLVYPEDLEFLKTHRRDLREGVLGIKCYYSYRTLTKNGNVKWIDQFSKTIIFEGEPAELITIIDITEKKEAEEELINLNKLKSELFVRTSHELKTPLVSIKGFSDLLLTGNRSKLDNDSISKITEIKNGADRLQKLIGDILKSAELESGYTKIKLKSDNLSNLINICVKGVQGFADLRKHQVELNVEPNLITNFEREQIHKVVSNLLNNAIKYTPPNGKIEINSIIKNNVILTSIKDNGIGLTKEEKQMVFKQFGKIERYGQNLQVISEGTGLGLFISKKIVELHGGEIWVESKGRNQGSTFYFTLPITQD